MSRDMYTLVIGNVVFGKWGVKYDLFVADTTSRYAPHFPGDTTGQANNRQVECRSWHSLLREVGLEEAFYDALVLEEDIPYAVTIALDRQMKRRLDESLPGWKALHPQDRPRLDPLA